MLHRETRLCTMLDSGGKSRVKITLQPLSGSAHHAIIPAHSCALAVGNDENGAFCGYLPTTSPEGKLKVPGARNQVSSLLTITYIFQVRKSTIDCQGCHNQKNFFW